jgi:branched-chain amino acid transport system permease protein
MQTVLDLLFGGLSLGAIYALMAFALSIALATTHVLNVAHGLILVLGAAAATYLIQVRPIGILAALAILIVGSAVFGLAFERTFVRQFLGKSPEEILIGTILVTFGFALAVEALLGYYWAKWVDPTPSFTLSFPWPQLTVGRFTLSGTRLAILSLGTLAIAAFHLFLTRTPLGKAIRAVAQNYEGAIILGLNPRLISLTVYSVGITATAISGVLLALAIPLEPYSGTPLTLIALTVVVIGGVGSLPGALVGGALLGVAEVLTAYTLGAIWAPVVSLLVFFGVLVVRPEGLFGRRTT